MKKIIVLGNVSTGKSTFATKLGAILHLPVTHLDKLFWVEEKGIKQDVFIAQQQEIMKGESWILDGNFMRSKSYDLRLENADTIIYLDYSLALIYWRLLSRGIKYFNKFRPDMAGNRKDHINWHIIKFIWNYPRKEQLDRVLTYKDSKPVYVFKRPAEAKAFLQSLTKKTD